MTTPDEMTDQERADRYEQALERIQLWARRHNDFDTTDADRLDKIDEMATEALGE